MQGEEQNRDESSNRERIMQTRRNMCMQQSDIGCGNFTPVYTALYSLLILSPSPEHSCHCIFIAYRNVWRNKKFPLKAIKLTIPLA